MAGKFIIDTAGKCLLGRSRVATAPGLIDLTEVGSAASFFHCHTYDALGGGVASAPHEVAYGGVHGRGTAGSCEVGREVTPQPDSRAW